MQLRWRTDSNYIALHTNNERVKLLTQNEAALGLERVQFLLVADEVELTKRRNCEEELRSAIKKTAFRCQCPISKCNISKRASERGEEVYLCSCEYFMRREIDVDETRDEKKEDEKTSAARQKFSQ
jgi:hypothetical protein